MILSCLLVGEARADFTSGNFLWDACQADETKDPMRAMFCTSYIVGAGETFQALQVAKPLSVPSSSRLKHGHRALNKIRGCSRSLHVNMALGSRSVGYHSAVRGPGPPSLHPSNEPGPQNLIAAMLCPLATPGCLPLVN